MINDRILSFRRLITLRDGVRVLLRALTPVDRDALFELYAAASDNEVRYLRRDVRVPEVIAEWVEQGDYKEALPIIALVEDRIVGEASLRFRTGPHAHVAEVRIFLANDFRRRGLCVQMMEALFELARWRSIHLLEAQIIASQTRPIKAFKRLGFVQMGLLEDYFVMPGKGPQDVAILVKRLLPPQEGEF